MTFLLQKLKKTSPYKLRPSPDRLYFLPEKQTLLPELQKTPLLLDGIIKATHLIELEKMRVPLELQKKKDPPPWTAKKMRVLL